MTENELLIWAAGVFEGEGCFRVKPGSRKGYRASLVVNIGSTDKDVVERCCRVFPEHGKVHERTPKGCKTHYSVEWYGAKAEYVMKTLLPYMCKRRTDRITECLAAKNLSHHEGRIWPKNERGSDGRYRTK